MAIINRYFFVPIDTNHKIPNITAKHQSWEELVKMILFYFIVFSHYFVFEQSQNGRKAMDLLTAGINDGLEVCITFIQTTEN